MMAIVNCFNNFAGYVPIEYFPIQKAEASEIETIKVPILMFHHFVLEEEECYVDPIITKDKFCEVLDEITEMGYTTISFKELIDYAETGKELPTKPILITMDDGYKSNYDITFPILKERGMKATVSIIGRMTQYESTYITDWTLPHVSWNELKEMLESEVFELGNHTYDLHRLKSEGGKRNGITKNFFESQADYSEIVREDIKDAEEIFRLNCNAETDIFCYPYGFYDELSEAVISSLGYKVTLTTDEGINYIEPGDDLIGLKRINVTMQTDIKEYLD